MKIGIIGFNDLHIMPYLYKYTKILDDCSVNYDVIYWNRSCDDINKYKDDFRGNLLGFNLKINTYQPFYRKIISFLKYRNFVRKCITTNQYDKLIVLTSQSAVCIADVLLSKYEQKYVFDYRDVTKENVIPFYKNLINVLLDNSQYSMFSSLGFLKIVDASNDKVVFAQNTKIIDCKSDYKIKIKKDIPICISFWGMVRQVSHNKKICDIFGNDGRYVLKFYGEGYSKEIEEYCKSKRYDNIFFSGRYAQEQIEEFALNTNIIHCSYENDPTMKYAMQVKFYDSVKYKLPILVSKGSYIADYLQNYKFDFEIDVSLGRLNADLVYDWYSQCDMQLLNNEFSKMEENIYKSDIKFKDVLSSFLRPDT